MAETSPRRRFWIERPDCRLHVEAMGDGPPIVFAHGLGGSHLSWWQQLPEFASTHSCIAFAHRGFAPSSAPQAGPDPLLYADDLAALADRLELRPVVIVAQSMGGWTAIEFALRFPARVRALVLSSTSGTIDLRGLSPALDPRLAQWNVEAAAERERLMRAGIHVAAGARMAREQPALHLLYQQIDEASGQIDKTALRERLFAARARPAAVARSITVPVLVLTGEEDCVFPAIAGDALAASFPNARTMSFKQTGHSPYFERPLEFNAALAEFLATL